MNVLIAILILMITMAIGVPVALAFVASSAYLLAVTGTDSLFLLPYGFSRVNSIILLTIPMFILAGSLMEYGGIGKKLISAVEKLVGTVKGGLAIVTIISCAVFGAISGSSAATLTSIGSIMAPQLKENGNPDAGSSFNARNHSGIDIWWYPDADGGSRCLCGLRTSGRLADLPETELFCG